MLGWSINLFRIAGIQLTLHWTLLLLFGYAIWEGGQHAGALGLAWMSAYFTLLFACVVLHELGHCLAARYYGISVRRILLLPIGGMAEINGMPKRPQQEMVVAIAGPAVNLGLIGLLFAAGVQFPPDWQIAVIPLTLGELGRHLVLVNVIMGCFNLIPVFPMDGGRIFRALLALKLPYLRATFVAATLGKVLATVGAGVMVLVFDHWLGAGLFLFIFFAGELEYRVLRRQEREEERWQRLLAQFCVDSPRVFGAPTSRSGEA